LRHIIAGSSIVVHTDHKSLQNLNLKNPTGVVALSNIKTNHILEQLNYNLFWKIEMPERIITDFGSQWTSEEFKIVLERKGIFHSIADPWKEALAITTRNLNHSVNTSTNMSPYEVLYGQKPQGAEVLVKNRQYKPWTEPYWQGPYNVVSKNDNRRKQ